MLEDQENRQEEKEDEPTREREREKRGTAKEAANVDTLVHVDISNEVTNSEQL